MYFVRKIALGATLGLACAATQATAQEKSFKEAIIGPWIITAVFDEYQNGEKKDNWGGPVKGQNHLRKDGSLHSDYRRSSGSLDEERRSEKTGCADCCLLRFLYG